MLERQMMLEKQTKHVTMLLNRTLGWILHCATYQQSRFRTIHPYKRWWNNTKFLTLPTLKCIISSFMSTLIHQRAIYICCPQSRVCQIYIQWRSSGRTMKSCSSQINSIDFIRVKFCLGTRFMSPTPWMIPPNIKELMCWEIMSQNSVCPKFLKVNQSFPCLFRELIMVLELAKVFRNSVDEFI